MYFVYVIKSDVYNRIYIGMTSDVDTRVTQHNKGKTTSTKPYVPWRLIYNEIFLEKDKAPARERQIKKSGTVRKALKEERYQGPIV